MINTGRAPRTAIHLDDDKMLLKMTRLVLESQGFTVFSHTNPQAALTQLTTMAPSLILLDINMPLADGFDVCRQIRQRHPGLRCPVVFLTSNKTTRDVAMAKKVGGDYFITKPLTPESLIDGITKAFAIKRR